MDSNFLPTRNAYDGFERSIAGFRFDIGQLEGQKLTLVVAYRNLISHFFPITPQFPASISTLYIGSAVFWLNSSQIFYGRRPAVLHSSYSHMTCGPK